MYYLANKFSSLSYIIDEDTLEYKEVNWKDLYKYDIHFMQSIESVDKAYYRGGMKGMFIYDRGGLVTPTRKITLMNGNVTVKLPLLLRHVTLLFCGSGKVCRHKVKLRNGVLLYDKYKLCECQERLLIPYYMFKFKDNLVLRVLVYRGREPGFASQQETVALILNPETGDLVDYSVTREYKMPHVVKEFQDFKHTSISARMVFRPLEI